jgi:hypothetical protein
MRATKKELKTDWKAGAKFLNQKTIDASLYILGTLHTLNASLESSKTIHETALRRLAV